MFTAVDNSEQRVYAYEVEKGTPCFCQACGEPLQIRKGTVRKAHFSHLPQSECVYGLDKDNKSEWHIRMQDYFPRESQEVPFRDEETGEIHIADVFLKDSNTVIEFQHSRISEEEYLKRTIFHIKNGRRIAWFLDESSQGKGSILGRFKPCDYSDGYQWVRSPRQFLRHIPDLEGMHERYSVCVYTGTEGDKFRRIVEGHYHFKTVEFSNNIIDMSIICMDQVFEYDGYWRKLHQRPKNPQSWRHHGQYQIRVRKKRGFRF